jgi:hypothetical protein
MSSCFQAYLHHHQVIALYLQYRPIPDDGSQCLSQSRSHCMDELSTRAHSQSTETLPTAFRSSEEQGRR